VPNPLPGDGDLTFTVGQVLPIATVYLAPFVASPSTQAAPGVKLGTSEPTGTWQKVGLLHDDAFTVDETDAEVIEYRRGFRQRYFGEVVRKAGQRTVVAQIIEVEPTVIADLLGETVTATGSPFTSEKLNVGTSEQIDKSMLVVYQEALSGIEFHYYSPHVISRFKMIKIQEFIALELRLKLITFKTTDVPPKYKDIVYYHFF
jgi:hypothetical protein